MTLWETLPATSDLPPARWTTATRGRSTGAAACRDSTPEVSSRSQRGGHRDLRCGSGHDALPSAAVAAPRLAATAEHLHDKRSRDPRAFVSEPSTRLPARRINRDVTSSLRPPARRSAVTRDTATPARRSGRDIAGEVGRLYRDEPARWLYRDSIQFEPARWIPRPTATIQHGGQAP